MSERRPIWAARRFVKTWATLTNAHWEKVIEFLISFPDLIESPHLHSGFGLRRLRGTFFYEARLDLRWRLIFGMGSEEVVLFDLIKHYPVRRLRSNDSLAGERMNALNHKHFRVSRATRAPYQPLSPF